MRKPKCGSVTRTAASVAASEGMVLEHPGLGQRLAAGLEKRAQFDWIGPIDDEVELRPPVAGDPVRNGLDELIRAEGPARGRHHEVRFDAKGQRTQRTAQELDHELPHPFRTRLAGLPTAPETSCPYGRKLARVRLA